MKDATRALVMGVKLAMEGPPGRVGPLLRDENYMVIFRQLNFRGPLSILDWTLLSPECAPQM